MGKLSVFSGLDRLSFEPSLLPFLSKSAKIGLITNHTGITKNCTPTHVVLAELYTLTSLFAPEHGIRGDRQAGAAIEEEVDPVTGIPCYSVYGRGRERAHEVMRTLDAIFFDIQDIGSRYYTYQYAMTDAMQVCAEAGVPFIVLDRPPMLGTQIEGNLLDPRFASGVGRFPTPTRPGLTIGEFASYINETERLGCPLTVLPCGGVLRRIYFDETDCPFVMPSPNLPSVECALLYVGTCLFEGTNLSEGRGTTRPFEYIGAPWLRVRPLTEALNRRRLPGCLFREMYFTPMFSKYAGELCSGIQIHVYNRAEFRPFETALWMIQFMREQNPEFRFLPGMPHLFGSDEILADDFDPHLYLADQGFLLAGYAETVPSYYLYD